MYDTKWMVLYKDIANYIAKWIDTSKYDEKRPKIPLPKRKNKKVFGFMKDERSIRKFQNLQELQQKHGVIESKKLIKKWKILTLINLLIM